MAQTSPPSSSRRWTRLSAIGVTFPVHCYYPILSGNTTQQDSAVVLRPVLHRQPGDDFIVLDVVEYVSSITQEIINAHKPQHRAERLGADFGDPINFLGQEILHDDNAYYAMNYGFIGKIVKEGSTSDWQSDLVAKFEEFTTMVNDASAIVDDIDARYDAFADAEAYMLQHALTMPAVYEVSWCLTHATNTPRSTPCTASSTTSTLTGRPPRKPIPRSSMRV